MAKLPRPPVRLVLPPELHTVPAGSLVWRIFWTAGPHPTTWNVWRPWGPTGSRFDHQMPPPQLQARAILYGATGATTCFAEFFQRRRTINRSRRAPCLAAFRTTRALTLLDLTGEWPTRAGASMAINTGPRGRAREWSRVIYASYPDVEGLWYGSSMHGNRPCMALYERGRSVTPPTPDFHRLLSDPAMWAVVGEAAGRLGYRVV